jgi:hypothetical protein
MSDNKQQSSVQWFYDKLIEHGIIVVNQTTYQVKCKHEILLEQAKEMFEEQMIDFANGYSAQDQYKISAKHYYKENYKGNNE